MSEMSRDARRAMRAKAHRLATATTGKVDASDYGPEEVLDADVQTGMRPISRRQFKSGGTVTGAAPAPNAGRAPRKSGGRALTATTYLNRDQKEANEEREGKKHIGGMRSGGRVARADGGETKNAGDLVPTSRMAFEPAQSRAIKAAGLKHGGRSKKADGGLISAIENGLQGPNPEGSGMGDVSGAMARRRLAEGARAAAMQRAMAGPGQGGNLGSIADIVARGNRDPYERMPRKRGGRTNVNIVIATGAGRGQQQPGGPMPAGQITAGAMPVPVGAMGGPPGAPPGMPPGPPPGAPPPMPMPPAGGPPPGVPPGMMRKAGGRVGSFDAGAGSGLGRLEKTAHAKRRK